MNEIGESGRRTPGVRGQQRVKNLLLRALGSVLGTALVALLNTGGVKGATYDGVTNTREVFHTTTTHQTIECSCRL